MTNAPKTIPVTDIYSGAYRDDGFANEPCYLCGRETAERASTRYVEVLEGGSAIAAEPLTDEQVEAQGGAYLGCHPVGSACAKRARKAGALVRTAKQMGF